jgi:hypothetical protein
LLAASEIKGAKVTNFQNQDIGDIDELRIEPATGQVRFAVLSVGSFLGLGSTKVAVPWWAFQIVSERGKIKYMMLDATRERLEKAPRRRRQKLSATISRGSSRTNLRLLGCGVGGVAIGGRVYFTTLNNLNGKG